MYIYPTPTSKHNYRSSSSVTHHTTLLEWGQRTTLSFNLPVRACCAKVDCRLIDFFGVGDPFIS